MDGVDNVNLDVTDSGQLFNALSGYANIQNLSQVRGLRVTKLLFIWQQYQEF